MTCPVPVLEKPVFVVGHPRSGTTLLATVLGRHPDLAMPPETQFFVEQRRFAGKQLSIADMEQILDNRRIGDLGLDRARALAVFSGSDHSWRAAFATLLEVYRQARGKPRAGEKSPMHLHHVETLLGWFPDARIVCIERNGADVVASMLRMPWAHDHAGKHAMTWAAACRRARALEARFPERFFRVRFETFTAAPDAELQRICAFCGLEALPEMLGTQEAGTVPDWEKDWKQGVSRPIEPQRSAGIDSLTPRQRIQFGAVANGAQALAGYPITPVSALQRARVWATIWPWHPSVRPHVRKITSRVRRKDLWKPS